MANGNDRAQIFVRDDGVPYKFHLVSGPTFVAENGGLSPERVKALTKKIEKHGGKIAKSFNENNTVWIVRDTALGKYKRYCLDDPAHRAEGGGFIERCIIRGEYIAESHPVKTRIHGRHPGRRSHFTAEEEELLCQWIAMKIPDPASGGRLGNKVYEALMDAAAEFPDGRWGLAVAHPMSSWKEHYRRQALRLDPRITEIAEEMGYKWTSRTTYQSDRHINLQEDRRHKTWYEEEEEDDDEGEFQVTDQLSEEDDEGEFRPDEDFDSDRELSNRPLKRRRLNAELASAKTPRSNNIRPGPEEAGPSGIRDAEPSVVRHGPPKPRPISRPKQRFSDESPLSPMNTQATLVNPISSQEDEDVSPHHNSRIRSSVGTSVIEISSDNETQDIVDASPGAFARAAARPSNSASSRPIARAGKNTSPTSGSWYVGTPPSRLSVSREDVQRSPRLQREARRVLRDDMDGSIKREASDEEDSQTNSISANAVEELVEGDSEEYDELDDEEEDNVKPEPAESDDARGIEALLDSADETGNPFAEP